MAKPRTENAQQQYMKTKYSKRPSLEVDPSGSDWGFRVLAAGYGHS